MPRLVALRGGLVANIAFGVNEISSRAEIDQALVAEWSGKYEAVAFCEDPVARVEIGDEWDGTKGVEPLSSRRARMLEIINAKTREIIVAGYEWPVGSGRRFSLSDTAQRNLSELDKIRDTLITYPLPMSLRDDSDVYFVPDANELHGMYLAGLAAIKYAYIRGNELKGLVHEAASHAELDAVVDDR